MTTAAEIDPHGYGALGYRRALYMHMRLGRGGYQYVYRLLHHGRVVGTQSVLRESSKVDEVRSFALDAIQDRVFDTPAEAIAAHQALWHAAPPPEYP